MRCRKVVDSEIVWFNSLGINEEGNSIKCVDTSTWNKTSDEYRESSYNFASEQQGVADSLTQRLSILKGELWWNVNYGLPLIDKVKSKEIVDSTIAQIILSNDDVIQINSFSSTLVDHKYFYNAKILSKYGELNLSNSRLI